MAQKNRTKEIWLIPKRGSLHQTICLIDGIIERKYNGTSWNSQKQNNLGVNLKNWGATKSGKNISPQAIRTLVASVPQYLGFVYINTDTTPNTICLTEAGMQLWHKYKNELTKIPNLVDGKDDIIVESEIVLRQMEKLQITNPVIAKDCENIYVFPFRFMLKVLLKLKYLDQEEIAYFLFKVRNEDEVDVIVQEIINFRNLDTDKREALINAFKATHIGNITLVQASSASYFISLCQITGIIDKLKVTPNNMSKKLPALRIKESYIDYVKESLEKKYNRAETYDFADNLQLWIDYIGNPERQFPPINVTIKNTTKNDYLVQVQQDAQYKFDDLIYAKDIIQFPMFVNEEYNINIISVETGNVIETLQIIPTFDQREFEIHCSSNDEVKETEDTIESLTTEIVEHCESSSFAGKTLNYLNTLKKATGIEKTSDKYLRGAFLEFYFFKLLNLLKNQNIIDEVIWNGKIGKYGLPVPAPGGVTGTPDIAFVIDDMHYVLELTTIKSKSQQFSAEGSSVPDHIRLYKQMTNKEVIGVFCAPIIHERNTAAMQSTIAAYGIKLKCITDKEILEIFKHTDKDEIKKLLED